MSQKVGVTREPKNYIHILVKQADLNGMYAKFNNNKLTISCTSVHKKKSIFKKSVPKIQYHSVNISAGLSMYTKCTLNLNASCLLCKSWETN